MKISNIILSMMLVLMCSSSIALADGTSLKVEASSGTKFGPNSLSVTVTNISNTKQEFYSFDCRPALSFITDNPSILLGDISVRASIVRCAGLIKIILKPSDSKHFTYFLFDTKIKPITFKLGFIYLNQEGKRDVSKEVVWSNPLNISAP